MRIVIMATMTRQKKDKADALEFIQAGWRVEKRDLHLLDELQKFADDNRYSRNVAITIAVEHFLKWLKTQPK
jgi:uncharacterized protein YihD (DUF1040 family)